MQKLEIKLYNAISELFQEIKDMHPADGLHSPRDLQLVKEINKKAAIMDKMQEAMRIINPHFEIRD